MQNGKCISTLIFQLEILKLTFQGVPFILKNSHSVKSKLSYHLRSDQHFWNFGVNDNEQLSVLLVGVEGLSLGSYMYMVWSHSSSSIPTVNSLSLDGKRSQHLKLKPLDENNLEDKFYFLKFQDPKLRRLAYTAIGKLAK